MFPTHVHCCSHQNSFIYMKSTCGCTCTTHCNLLIAFPILILLVCIIPKIRRKWLIYYFVICQSVRTLHLDPTAIHFTSRVPQPKHQHTGHSSSTTVEAPARRTLLEYHSRSTSTSDTPRVPQLKHQHVGRTLVDTLRTFFDCSADADTLNFCMLRLLCR